MKNLLTISAVIALILMLTGCNQQSQSGGQSPATDSDASRMQKDDYRVNALSEEEQSKIKIGMTYNEFYEICRCGGEPVDIDTVTFKDITQDLGASVSRNAIVIRSSNPHNPGNAILIFSPNPDLYDDNGYGFFRDKGNARLVKWKISNELDRGASYD